jgi:hypothetical protein
MAKKIPNVLDDLLFHTAESQAGQEAVEALLQDWHPPRWKEEAGCDPATCSCHETRHASDGDSPRNVTIHPDRWPELAAYAATRQLTLRDAVDQALALLLPQQSRPRS